MQSRPDAAAAAVKVYSLVTELCSQPQAYQRRFTDL